MSARTESELKIPSVNLDQVRKSLERLGARCVVENEREVNVLFDFDDRRLATVDSVLRVRRTGNHWVLTFKGAPRYEGEIKLREELETEVSEGELLTEVFERLGLIPTVRYEKDRELWLLDGVEVALDHTPMGDFVELEGPVDVLEDVAARLGLETESAVKASYPTLWLEYRQQSANRELPHDMVFEP
jgi:adenylate cyclase class 2